MKKANLTLVRHSNEARSRANRPSYSKIKEPEGFCGARDNNAFFGDPRVTKQSARTTTTRAAAVAAVVEVDDGSLRYRKNM